MNCKASKLPHRGQRRIRYVNYVMALITSTLLLGAHGVHAAPGDPVVNFAQGGSSVDEGEGTVGVRVVASAVRALTVNYTVTPITATLSTDVVVPTGPVAFSGGFGNINVQVVNDNILPPEPVELLVIKLEPGLGYEVGPHNEHTLNIIDNEAVWNGVLESNGAQVDVNFEIVDSATGLQAWLVSDGFGGFPQGRWPADISRGADSFNLGPVSFPIPAAATAFNRALMRQLTMQAVNIPSSSPNPDQQVVTQDIVRGTYTDVLNPTTQNGQHLRRTIDGTFTLLRQSPDGTGWKPTLENSL